MSNHTILGVSVGAIIGAGGAATNLGNAPFLLFLSGANDPAGCLEWMKNPTEVGFYHPCYPITDPQLLVLMSNVLVFIALLLITWWVIESVGKLRSNF